MRKWLMISCLMPVLVFAQTGSLKGKQIGVIGDSYVRNHVGKIEDTWHYKFAQKHQMQYFNYGRNGNCIALDLERWGPGMYQRYKDMKDSLDYIIVIAGHNDAVRERLDSIGMDTFRERLGLLCSGLIERYPNAMIFFFTPWSYVKLKNITLGYTLPQSVFLKSNFIRGARFFVDAQNVATFTGYDGFDPELSTGNPYPQALSLSFGFNLNF